MALTTPIKRTQYAQKVSENFEERIIFHFETDTKQVLVGDTQQTLDELLQVLDGERSITLSGEVTGTVKTDGHSNIVLETTVTPDGHDHSGSTVKVEEPGRVVVSTDDKSIIVSKVTVEELEMLSGVTANVQKQLDDKVKASETNGNILVDGVELPVYVHPKVESFESSELDSVDLDSGSKILSVKEIQVDDKGHISGLTMQPYNMPMISKFWVSTEEPTGQVVGDFWLETLNVEVEPGSFYLQPAGDNPNLAETLVVGAGTSGYFTLTDPKTDKTESAGIYENYTLSDPT
ncbi:MAG: hypothetical protein NC489_08180 [Ruminococcus flavefaciens]|nr:hypothetical protein [Ruminococcus flavefaciens]